LHFELTRELLDVEQQYRTLIRRAGLFEALEQAFKRSFYTDEADAIDRARRRNSALAAAQNLTEVRPQAPQQEQQPLPFTQVPMAD
jgi:DNA sulfur modification protein DndC